MTRKEAIVILNMVEAYGLANEAKKVAIEALSQESCEDAISRQAVLDYFFRPYSNEESYSNIDIAKVIKALPPVNPQEPRWILTSEKLPPIGEWVIVTNGKCNKKYCEIMVYHGLKTQKSYIVGGGEYEKQYHEWTSGHGDISSENPLAWMPLPKPYEPTCDTCKYNTAAFNPCNACKNKSEYEPQKGSR